MQRLLRGGVLALVAAILAVPQAPTARADAPHVEPSEPVVQAAPQHPIKPDSAVAAPDQAQRARAAATATGQVTAAPFLTRPYWHHHDVTSVFDHCNPNYTQDGQVCEEDGTTAFKSYGTAPDLASGYAVTPGGNNYLYYDGHDGWDISLNYETLLAAAGGTVYYAGWSSYGFGMTVVIDHPNGLSTRYGHMSRIDVTQGQQVYRGQQIGISGNTGNSTGPHLHFGVYRNDPWTAIDPWGWSASAADPWPYQEGDLWITGNPVDPVPTAPTNVAASAIGGYVKVTWTQPTFDGASPITGFTITASPGGPTVNVAGSATSATLGPLTSGTTYTFTVTATNQVGPGDPSAASNAVTIGPPAYESWFNWFDNVTPGMSSDNLHLVNPSSTTTVSGYVLMRGSMMAVSIAPGGEQILTFPPNTIGGPIHLLASGNVLASQRVEYFQSFNEVPASAQGRAAPDLYLAWYDLASAGMVADNIHIVNPGTASAHVSVTGPGAPLAADIGPGAETWLSWPAGTIGGPVHISTSATTPVLASQRVQYNGTFNEVAARPATDAATSLVFNWYDHASPGMWNDNVHVVNPQSTAATVTVSVAGAQQTLAVPAHGTGVAAFPQGTIGGPVTVSSNVGVLASQRVQYYDSFNEVLGSSGPGAASTWLPWYDDLSPGMVNDNVHILNPSQTLVAHVTVTGPGTTRTFDLAPGGETFVGWAGGFGGPVHVTSTGTGVIASQRVQFYGSFNESAGLAG